MKEINELLEKFEISDFKNFLNFFIADIFNLDIRKSQFFNSLFYHNKKEEGVLSSNYIDRNKIELINGFSGYISQYDSYSTNNSHLNFTLINEKDRSKKVFFHLDWNRKKNKIQKLKIYLTLNDLDLSLEIESPHKYISELSFEFNNNHNFLLTTKFKVNSEEKAKPIYTYYPLNNQNEHSIEVFNIITQIMDNNKPILKEDLEMINLILDDNQSYKFFKNLVQSGIIPELVKQLNLLCFNANKDNKKTLKKNLI